MVSFGTVGGSLLVQYGGILDFGRMHKDRRATRREGRACSLSVERLQNYHGYLRTGEGRCTRLMQTWAPRAALEAKAPVLRSHLTTLQLGVLILRTRSAAWLGERAACGLTREIRSVS
jgi:hypothetical protein